MQKIKFSSKYIMLMVGLVMLFSCKDESLSPIPAYETAVHALGVTKSGSATAFKQGDLNTKLDFDFKWNSIDGKNTVTKIQYYVQFNEGYTDAEGNDRIANHGVKLFKTIEGSAVPANRVNTSFSISQAEVLALFNGVSFDYKDGKGSVNVFTKSPKAARVLPGTPFITNAKSALRDNFIMTWAFTTDDGRVFDSWSDSICGEFPGADCDVRWDVK